MSDINDLGLGDTYRVRPLAMPDAHAVYELMAKAELATTGEVMIEEADIVGDWQRPDFDLATQSIGVFDGELLVAYGDIARGRWADAAVDPEYMGRGIGTAIALWHQRVSRRDGTGLVGMPVPEGSPGDRLLTALGYSSLWTSWVLQLPVGKAIEPQPLPNGYTVRAASGESEWRTAHEVIDTAFLEWSERDPDPYEAFEATTIRRPGFAPWNIRVALGPSGEVVGAAVVFASLGDYGYVDKLAVRADQRGQGLARALLADAFETARSHGGTVSELSTDSRTGALSLYEKVGMEVTQVWKHLAIQT